MNVMQLSKIKLIATYYKCMRDLCRFGLINYSPSYNSYQGTFVEINEFLKEKKLSEKIEIIPISINFAIPIFSEIEFYFKEKDFKTEDALRFQIFYRDSNWMLSNKSQMKCWKAAARNWILKLKKNNNFQPILN